MPSVIVDPDSRSLDHRFALVHAPARTKEGCGSRTRQPARFPEGCVRLTLDESAARAGADPERHLHPAEVYGPSVSSEGQRVYYLVRWLDRAGPPP